VSVLSRVKRPGLEDDHLTLRDAEVKNEWSYTSIVPIRLQDLCRKKFTLLLVRLYNSKYNRCQHRTIVTSVSSTCSCGVYVYIGCLSSS
jgi:hypothetical protein